MCSKPIEKNGGCMHMTCRKESAGCGHEFCWLCRGAWSDHGSSTGGFYACNKYDASKAKKEDATSIQAKTELGTTLLRIRRVILPVRLFSTQHASHITQIRSEFIK